jgi:hypothetical protein
MHFSSPHLSHNCHSFHLHQFDLVITLGDQYQSPCTCLYTLFSLRLFLLLRSSYFLQQSLMKKNFNYVAYRHNYHLRLLISKYLIRNKFRNILPLPVRCADTVQYAKSHKLLSKLYTRSGTTLCVRSVINVTHRSKNKTEFHDEKHCRFFIPLSKYAFIESYSFVTSSKMYPI